jgi:hypothetical protein
MRSSFARLLEPLDRRVMARLVAEHRGDRGVGKGEHAWTCERHLKTLLFAQWAGLRSLREMVAGLTAHGASFYHLNLRAPCRSTLSDANGQRPAGSSPVQPVPSAQNRKASAQTARAAAAKPASLLRLQMIHSPKSRTAMGEGRDPFVSGSCVSNLDPGLRRDDNWGGNPAG